MSDDEGSYRFVMPFICCKDNGGTFDTTSFCAGANFGQHMAELKQHPPEWSNYVFPEMVAQYDLLAMSEGYTMTAEPWDEHPDEWVLVEMTRK